MRDVLAFTPTGESLVQGGEDRVVVCAADHHDNVGIADILRVADHCHLVLLGIGRYQGITVVQEAAVVPERVFALRRTGRRAAFEAHVAKPALFVFLLQSDIQHLFPVAVLKAGGARLLAFPVDYADLVHHGRRQVVQGRALVIEEEGPAAHGEFVDFLAVELDLSVLGDLHARHPFQQVLQHRIGPDAEGGGVELYRVFLDDDGVTHVGDRGRLQEVLIDLKCSSTCIRMVPMSTSSLRKYLSFTKGLYPIISTWKT